MQAVNDPKGFFNSLFDFSFKSLITSRLITVLYVLAVVLIGIYSLFLLAAGFSRGAMIGVVALIAVPLFFLLSVIYTRVILEVLIVIFRIHENLAAMARLQGAMPVFPVSDHVRAEPPIGAVRDPN
jgi:hypothetical protein